MEEFILKYFPEYIENEKVQMEILRQFAEPICGIRTERITNSLFRGGIRSIEKLWKTSLDDIKMIRNVGEDAMEYIKEMKHEISRAIHAENSLTEWNKYRKPFAEKPDDIRKESEA